MKNPRIWFDKLSEPARESGPRTATAWAWNDPRNPVRRVLPAAPHQAFRLRIDEAGGVFRVPGGPIEHWAVIYGVLEEGALWPNDRIVLSVAGGRAWSARVHRILAGCNAVAFSPEDGEHLLGLTRDPRASVRRAAEYVFYDERFAPCIGLQESLRENEDLEVRRVAQAIQRRVTPTGAS